MTRPYEQADRPRATRIEQARAELERAVRSGESRCAERCIERLASIGLTTDEALDLIYSEFLLRERLGQSSERQPWFGRFPQFEADLRELFDIHDELAHEPLEAAKESPPDDQPPAPDASAIGGNYVLESELGRGGMGVVYRAVDRRLQRTVAVKFLHAEQSRDGEIIDRFRREAVMASSLNSPNVCTIYEFDEHLGQPFIAMEWIEGVTLRERAAAGATLTELVGIIVQVARALAVAHAAGVVHRDIKPNNLMVRGDGLVKVLDFGMARLTPGLRARRGEASRTVPGTLIGTAAYMSPEQARGETAGPESDVFSLGIVLYELTTGRHPFESTSPVGLLGAIVEHTPLVPSSLAPGFPRAIEALLTRMLEKSPALRPTADTVAATLAAWLSDAAEPTARRPVATPARLTIGRDAELELMRGAFSAAADGRGSVLCIAGEPGIGKTTLVEAFLAGLAGQGESVGIAHGRSSERLAGSEAYLPVLEALENLLRRDAGGSLASLLKLLAPSWSAQLSTATALDPIDRPSSIVTASTQERTKRELLAFLEAAGRERTIVLCLDDQHWGDPSTVDLLSYLGQRCGQMRFLILISYRPTDLVLARHPLLALKQELEARGICREIRLSFLGPADVGLYLDSAFPGHRFPDDFAAFIHSKTSGSPLFVVDLMRYLRDVGVIALADSAWALAKSVPDFQRELPQSVRSMVQRNIDQLAEDDRRLLTAASVQGQEFDACVIASAIGAPAADVEERLDALDRVHAVVRRVREQEYPDQTLTVRYAFVHVLYQNALYAALQPARKAMLCMAIANAILTCHCGSGSAVAAELALLLETARDFRRAAQHCQLAARNATRLFAYREACGWARRGLTLIGRLTKTDEDDRLELRLLVLLGINNVALSNFAAPEVADALTRARGLSQTLGDTSELPSIHWGLFFYHAARGEYVASHAAAQELLTIADQRNAGVARLLAHPALVLTHVHRGELEDCRRHVEETRRQFSSAAYAGGWSHIGQDPKVLGIAFGALSSWLGGYPDRAREECAESVALAAEPASRAFSVFLSAWVASCCRDDVATHRFADALGVLAEEHKFTFWNATSRCFRGLALVGEHRDPEAIELLRDGLEDFERDGAAVLVPLFTMPMCALLSRAGRADEALERLDRVRNRADENANRYFLAECWRMRGELLEINDLDQDDVRLCYQRAVDVARQQRARSLELRAATSLARFVLSHDAAGARAVLQPVLDTFTEGFDTRDYRDATALLRSL